MNTTILGISAYYRDSAAALLVDGEVGAAVQEERCTRKKRDAGFPADAVRYCVSQAGGFEHLDYVVFYDKPLVKLERLLEAYRSFTPKGLFSFMAAVPIWLKDKLFLKETLKRELTDVGGIEDAKLPPLLFSQHHRSHAASAFFPSPFERAAVLCLDGVGEWATSSVWVGEGHNLTA